MTWLELDFLLFIVSDADPWWTVGLAMIGKFNIALSFAVIYVYAGELMPTVVRSQVSFMQIVSDKSWNPWLFIQAMGISSFVAGIGLLVFPYINSLVSEHDQLVRDWYNPVPARLQRNTIVELRRKEMEREWP